MRPPNRTRIFEASKYFKPNSPIKESELFVGRLDQVQGVVDAVHQEGLHAILYGERGVGKTSLAAVLSQFLSAEQILCRRIHCEAADAFSDVWERVFDQILMTQKNPRAGLGESVAEIEVSARNLFGGKPSANAVLKVLMRLADHAIPILIIDEFDQLQKPVKETFAELVKMLSDYSVPATLVLVGLANSVDELIDGHESVERALLQIYLPRMSNQEIREIIGNGLAKLDLEIEPIAERRIINLSQGLPHYAHLLGLHAVRLALLREADLVSANDVDQAIEKALSQAQQSRRDSFQQATQSPRADNLYRHVLTACAIAETDGLGYFAAADIRKPIRQVTGRNYDIPAFARHLNSFCGETRGQVLEKTGTRRRYRFRFSNPLLQPFVIMHGLASGLLSHQLLSSRTGANGPSR